MRRLACMLLLLSWTHPAPADTVDCDGYQVHYTSFKSTIIPVEVAAAHHIVRSDNRVITNVSVRRSGSPARAAVEGTATDLLNQSMRLEFHEVDEADAVYYLASQVVDERDTVRYEISVRPGDSGETCTVKFVRDYFQRDAP
jgi:hypothetical protein